MINNKPIERTIYLCVCAVNQLTDKNGEIKNIIKYIKASGIPLEIEISDILKQFGWSVRNQAYYYDEEESKARTYDIYAAKLSLLKKSIEFDRHHLALIIECKKSNKPWLFYTTELNDEEDYLSQYFLWVKPFNKPRNNERFKKRELYVARLLHYFHEKIEKIAIIRDIAHTGKDDIFEASCQVLKGLHHQRKMYGNTITKLPVNPYTVIYPIIVFDGPLYEVEIIEEEVVVNPIDYIPYQVSGISSLDESFLIEVMTKNFFPHYLMKLKDEITNITNYLESFRYTA